METMTFTRYSALIERWEERPSIEWLLSFIASAYGYKPPTVKVGVEAAADLKKMFPTGAIQIG